MHTRSKRRALHGRVDRNTSAVAPSGNVTGRALHGRVDRNEGAKGWTNGHVLSRPSRARGSKLLARQNDGTLPPVAPFTGAWIETAIEGLGADMVAVAPFTGAWIETT